MALGGGVGISKGKTSLDATELIEYAEETEGFKQGQSTTSTIQQNSGRTDKTKSNTGSLTQNSGSVNTITEGASTSTTVNSGSVNTSQLMLSEDAVNHMAKQMLEGTSGLAAIAKGQNASGGYNTTTQALLTSDMTSRIAGEVAARGAKRVDVIGGSTSTTRNSGKTTTQNIGASSSSNFGFTDATTIVGESTSRSDAITDSLDFAKNTTIGVKERESSEDKKEEKVEAKSTWIVCTELRKQGKMENRIYLTGLAAFEKYDDFGKQGYYIWAVPAVKHLRAKPNSWFSKLLEKVFVSRATYIFACKHPSKAKKTLGGFLITHGLYALCWTLSRTVARNYVVDKETYNGVYNA